MSTIDKMRVDKMKLISFENGKPVPSGRTAKSHSRHYVPAGKDAFDRTYHHILSIGALGMQQNCRDELLEEKKRRIALARRMVEKLKCLS